MNTHRLFNSCFYISLCILIPSLLHGQVVWTEPAFPTVDDQVTLYYNSALGNGELQGVIPVYIHTGVITNNSSGPSDWQNVQTAWGTSDPLAFLNPEGNGIHTFDFNGLTISDYYQLDEGETVESLAMVFRNSNGTLVGRNADGSDIFYEVSSGSFSTSLQTPENGYAVLDLGDTYTILGQASESCELSLEINGEVVTTVTGTSLLYDFEANDSGQFNIALVGTNDAGSASDEASIAVLPDSPITGWPPAGSEDGIHYPSSTSTILQLHAPGKEFVFVVGDFNDWQLSFDYLMTQTPDGNKHWIEIDGLEAGTEYRFHYHIMPDDMRVADPYTEFVLDPWNDQWIPEETYPDMPAFPNMLTENTPVSVFQPGAPAFDWTDQDFERPAKSSLVIYELLVRDFTDERNYQTILDTLDYLDRLGINAIEFMPVNEFNGNDSWGYNPTFYLALDKAYGDKSAFKELVNACHERGIAVLLDVVLNHADYPNPFLKMYWNDESFQPAANNPWFNEVSPSPETWFFDWNHDSPATKYFMKRALKYWVDEYHIDGYRLDFSKGMTQTPGNVWSYDQARINLLNEYANHLWQDASDIYMILEHWVDLSENQTLVNDGFMVWANVTQDYNEASMGYPSDFGWASYQNQGMSNPGVVSYPESHDEERLMYKALQYGNSEGSYQVTDLNTALARQEAIQCFNILLPGPKLLWQFEELGYDYSINTCSDGVTISDECRTEAKPVRWDYRDDPNRYRIHQVIAGLCQLKMDYPDPFQGTNYNWDVGGYGKRLHLNGSSMDAVVVANFRVSNLSMIPGFQHTGTWYDYFSGEAIEVTDVSAFMSFAPGEYYVYVDQPVDFPSAIAEPTLVRSNAVAYPNPSAGLFAIEFPEKVDMNSVQIFNLNGREVTAGFSLASLHKGHVIQFVNNTLSEGVYTVQVRSEKQQFNARVMLSNNR